MTSPHDDMISGGCVFTGGAFPSLSDFIPCDGRFAEFILWLGCLRT